jgi:hypothetical protein
MAVMQKLYEVKNDPRTREGFSMEVNVMKKALEFIGYVVTAAAFAWFFIWALMLAPLKMVM